MDEDRVEVIRSKTMKKKSDDELHRIIAGTRDTEWEPEAIEAARRVLKNRYLEPTEAQQERASQLDMETVLTREQVEKTVKYAREKGERPDLSGADLSECVIDLRNALFGN